MGVWMAEYSPSSVPADTAGAKGAGSPDLAGVWRAGDKCVFV